MRTLIVLVAAAVSAVAQNGAQVCPDILIYAIDMVQPPGVNMLSDMDRHR